MNSEYTHKNIRTPKFLYLSSVSHTHVFSPSLLLGFIFLNIGLIFHVPNDCCQQLHLFIFFFLQLVVNKESTAS